jgi:MFS family permease
MLSFARKIIFCVDMRWVYLLSMIIFMVGAVVSGAADNMTAVIVGRIIMGVGGAMVQQL